MGQCWGQPGSSVSLEVQVAVEPKDSLPPEENEGRLVKTSDPLVDQRDCVSESTKNVSSEQVYLRSRVFDTVGVLVLTLIVAEEQFAWGCIIGVLA